MTDTLNKSGNYRGRAAVHGEARRGQKWSPEYRAWMNMRSRCLIKTNGKYPIYGGRGVRICDRWLSSFPAFLEDIGRRPSPEHSIDRIDVNGNYEPGNVRWADRYEQARNKRQSRFIEIDGRKLCIAEWSRETGIGEATIRFRLKMGWSERESVSSPTRRRSA